MVSVSDTIAEGAAPAADPHRFQAGRVITISAGHFVHDMYASFLAPLLPTFIAAMALSKTEAGLLMIFMQSPSVLQPVIGNLADRVNLRALVILGPAVTGVLMSLLGVAPGYAALALLLTLAGLSSAAFHSVAPPLAGALSGRKLGSGIGIWMVGGELGYTVGPLLVVSVVHSLTLKGTPWLMIIGFLATLLFYVRLRDVQGAAPKPRERGDWKVLLHHMKPLLFPLISISIARSFMVAGLSTFLPVLMKEQGASLWIAGASLSILQAAGVAGVLLAGSLSDTLGRRLTLAIVLASSPLLMFAFLAASGWAQFIILLLLGLTSLSVPTVLTALVQETYPDHRALANGIYGSMHFIVYAIAVAVVGVLGDAFGLRAAFAAGAVATFVALPLLLLLPGDKPMPSTGS